MAISITIMEPRIASLGDEARRAFRSRLFTRLALPRTNPTRMEKVWPLVALCLFSMGMSSPAKAQPTTEQDRPPAFFAEFRTKASSVEGVTVGPTVPYRLAVASGGSDYNFVEYLPWHELRLTFDLRAIRTAEPIMKTMRQLKSSLEKACSHAKLEQRPIGPRHGFALSLPTDKFMTEVYFRVFDEGLVGEFECQQAEAAPQLIRIKWDDGNRYPASVVPAYEWRFLVEGIGPEQLVPHRARFEQQRRKTDAMRARLAVGSNVQVMAEDVPATLLARYRQPENRRKHPFAICALVTEVRGPLAQVQIQAETIMLPAKKLLPMGRPSSTDEMSQRLQQQAPVQLACLK